MIKILTTIALCCVLHSAATQTNYTSYFTGSTDGVDPIAQGGICLMGGATENDSAMAWFLQRASGGDVLVLRASGSDGYNDYMYTDLGGVNSVETIVFNAASASYEPYVHQRIQEAEAIWFAGGDQWNYISYWRGTPVDSLIREAVVQRNIVIGGTSAGMVILGDHQFSAQNGTVSSASALANPYGPSVTIADQTFLALPLLPQVITDTHFDNPDRKGRLLTFIARALVDDGVELTGIACNEYTALCVEPSGIARAFGEYPAFDEFVWVVTRNCDVPVDPQVCSAGQPLTWDQPGGAVKAVRIPGTMSGTHTIDLNDRVTTSTSPDIAWYGWNALNGVFSESATTANLCASGIGDHALRSLETRWDADREEWVLSPIAAADVLSAVDLMGRRVALDLRVEAQQVWIRTAQPLILVVDGREGRRVARLFPVAR
jgi:cyanophycinase-like exopeptidase